MPTKIRPAQIQGTPGAFFAGGGTPVADAPRTPGEWQAFLNTLDAAKVEQEDKPE